MAPTAARARNATEHHWHFPFATLTGRSAAEVLPSHLENRFISEVSWIR
jgi:hypothetical protein